MADPLWHVVGEHTEAYLESVGDRRVRLSVNDVMVTAEGSSIELSIEQAALLSSVLSRWVTRTIL